MDIFPAIDLKDGKCVRLIQGDYDRRIDYSDEPAEMARRFADAGAEWLHVVDLDGARTGRSYNTTTIRQIIKATDLKVQIGGGIRDDRTVRRLLDAGATRVIIGTQALRQWQWFRQLVYKDDFAGRIALGLDARQGKLAVQGWTEQTQTTAADVAAQVSDWPLSAIIYTDIAKDGMLTGPNLQQTKLLTEVTNVPVIASGGVSSLEDIRCLAELPIAGMIVGRALYEGTLDLAEAVKLLRGQS